MRLTRSIFYLFLISIPFGTRILLYQFTNGFHEYEAVFLYASDILMILFLLSHLFFRKPLRFPQPTSSAPAADSFVLATAGFLLKRLYKNLQARRLRGFGEAETIFLLMAFISIFLAISKWFAIYNFVRLILLTLMALVMGKILKEGIVKLENIFSIIAGSAVFQSLIAIAQFFKQSNLGLKWLGESPLGSEIPGVAKVIIYGAKIVRAYGTFPHPNVLAAFLLLGLISLYYFYLRNYGKSRKYEKIFLVVGIFIASLGLLFTFSRTAWVLAILASIALIIYSKDWRLAIILFAITSILFAAFNPYILSRAKVSGQEPSVSYRLEYTKLALDLIKENPLGVGIGNQVLYSIQEGLYPKFGLKEIWQEQPVHNIYLLIASEIGILGLIAFLVFLYQLIIHNSLFIIPKVMLIALLLFGLFDHFLWTLQPGRLMLWLMIGLVFGLTKER